MSTNINSERVTFLLYLDDPIQSEIIDYIVDLSPSRKGEILREIISMGWEKFNKDKLSKKRTNRKNKKIIDSKKEEIKIEKIDSYKNIEDKKDSNDNGIEDNLNIKEYSKENKSKEININNEDNSEKNNNEDKIDKINPLSSFKKQFGV